jgi:hypothetical protein
MPFDPDTEIQYRKGGKIMKKTPRKFAAGGAAPAPTTKPAPKGGPKELQDEAEKMRQEARDKKQQEAGQRRPNLGLKKGGKVKKFSEGGDVDWVPQVKYRNLGDFFRGKRMEDEPKAEPKAPEAPLTRQRGSDYFPQKPVESAEDKAAMDAASAMASGSASSYGSQAQQDAPKGITGGENVVTEVKKAAPKPTAPKRFTPKAAPRKAAPSPRKAGNDPEPYIRREEQTEPQIGNKKSASTPRTGRTYNPQRAAVSAAKDFEALKSLGRRLLTTSSGQNVSGFAKGGGVEAKGKTKGKIVKMARGGGIEIKGKTRGRMV